MKRRERTDLIVIHCAYTTENMDIGAETIRQWHVEDRRWSDIGYHFVVRRDGAIDLGRDIWRQGAHEETVNERSVAICLVGGMGADGKPEDNFTAAQMESLSDLVDLLMRIYPDSRVAGHNEFDTGRSCPCFDVREWWYGA